MTNRPRIARRCDVCGGMTNSSRSVYCARCRPRGGAAPFPAVVAVLEAAIGRGLTPRYAADALGVSPVALQRRMHRHGRHDLARWLATDPDVRAVHAARKARYLARVREELAA